MRLRTKTLLVFSATVLVLTLSVSIVSQDILLRSYMQLEEQQMRQDLERVLNVVTNEIAHLGATARDWSAWDETYLFVQDANPTYVQKNLSDDAFLSLRINLMLFFDSTGQIVFGKAFDLLDEKETPLPGSLIRQISLDSSIIQHNDPESKKDGMLVLRESPILIASRPVLTSESTGPIRGALIVGRYLDSSEVNTLAATLNLSIQVQPADATDMPPDFSAAHPSLSRSSPILVRPLNAEQVAGYALVNDVYGNPGVIFRVDEPRNIYVQGRSAITYSLALMATTGAALATVTVLSFERSFLSPVRRLSNGVTRIMETGAVSDRVPMIQGAGEISDLAYGINRMLEALSRSHEVLRDSESKWRTLFENMAEGVYQSDPDGRLLTANPALVQMLGYDSEADLLAVKSLQDTYVNPEDRETWARELEKHGQLRDVELVLRRKDGSHLSVLDSAHVVSTQNGIPLYYEGSLMDITERKRMEKKLQEYSESLEELVRERTRELQAAKDRLEHVISSNPAVIYAGRPREDSSDFLLTYLSKRVVPMLGFEPQEFLGHPEFWESHVHPEDLSSVLAQMPHLWKHGQHTIEYRFLHKDGTYRWIREESKVIRHVDGRPAEIDGYWVDVTERKQLEEELAKSQRMATIGQVAAMVGHDLRNPLQALMNVVYLIESAPPSKKKELVGEYLETVREQLGYMNKIVSDLQDYARPLKPELAETDLRQLIWDSFSMANVPKAIDVKVEINEAARELIADPELLKRVFTNLITNAVQAMPHGGQLVVRASKTDNVVLVSIHDTGVGVPERDLNKIFMPLFTTKAKGQGFGLPACKRIVEAHNGTISFESRENEGTTALIRLPSEGM